MTTEKMFKNQKFFQNKECKHKDNISELQNNFNFIIKKKNQSFIVNLPTSCFISFQIVALFWKYLLWFPNTHIRKLTDDWNNCGRHFRIRPKFHILCSRTICFSSQAFAWLIQRENMKILPKIKCYSFDLKCVLLKAWCILLV